ncbi:MAG: hypothetical protein Q7U21_05315 [Lutibacter sp.]|jgi:hypothetical protein|nr:hypothetical protein [Lutibacter sp.]MDO9595835.1 hypothetical protein [Lutibacter sp.]
MNKLSIKAIIIVLFATFLSSNTLLAQSENEKINTLIEQKKAYNKTNKNIMVFKIQIYNGNETQAYAIKRNFEADFPEYRTKIIYKTPEWKTHAGNFRTRLEADRALNLVKIKYAGAIVLEEKI